MNEEKVKKILRDYITEKGGLHLNDGNWTDWYGTDEVTLDGTYDAETLEAIAWWMKNKNI